MSSPKDLIPKPKTNSFEINPRKDYNLKGEQGTEVRIPANSFCLKNGSPVFGNITIELQEFYNISDYLKSGLHTGTGHGALESGGTVFLNATSNGKALNLKEGAKIDIRMPSSDLKGGMNVYYAGQSVDSRGLWELGVGLNDQPQKIDTVRTIIDYNKAIRLLESGSASGLDQYLNETGIQINRVKQGRLLIHALRESKASIAENICERFKINEVIAYNHHQNEWDCSTGSGRPIYKASTQRVIEIEDYTDEGYVMDKINRVYMVYKDENDVDASLPGIAPQLQNRSYSYYSMGITQLGWINCDRFKNVPRTTVAADPGDENFSFCALVFPDINSIMAGGVYNDGLVRFHGVPKDRKGYIVAYSVRGGEIYFAKRKVNIDDKLKELEFAVVSKEELELEMNEFDTL